MVVAKLSTKDKIVSVTTSLMSTMDPENISVRLVSKETGIQASVIYHYFRNKSVLLQEAFLKAQAEVRKSLSRLPLLDNIHESLRQRLEYHFDNYSNIAAMLRYFLASKSDSQDRPGTYIPQVAYLHIKEVIDKGVEDGIYFTTDSARDARVIVHALNGFLLEHFPITPKTRDKLVNDIQPFIERALTNPNGGQPM